jgi:guanylate kinase
MRVDVQGAATIHKLVPNAIFIFLSPNSEEDLVKRLTERKSETTEGLHLRIATARQEMKRINEFDYVVINADSEQSWAVNQVLAIIDAAHSQVKQEPIVL